MKKGISIILLLTNFLFCGCFEDELVQKIDLSKREAVYVKEAENAITYAYLPQYSHTVSYQRHYLLIEYLKKETGLNIKQVFPDTFDEHMRMVEQGKIDISFSNPCVYVKIAHRCGAGAFAQVIEVYGKKNFRGQIICRSDNKKIKTLEDCKGKRWIAVDPSSAGGYLYPLGHFYDHGITKKDFAEIAFSPGPGGKQEKVVLAVYAGKYDIGSIREGTLNVVADKIDIGQIRVVAHSKWYPGWVYASRRELDPEIVGRIRDALLRLNYDNPEHRKILDMADITGVAHSKDSEFNSVRNLLTGLGIDLDR
ncbi:MAG: phosphate/phosphite/phosphonate ABC transporter substrate-binding protein [Candidatus Desulfaltia sp.]|nr:phosphate/phosphite/phosphonate ABC transporter substrate-binding protein [Candidatus Desulfaltia sp.]